MIQRAMEKGMYHDFQHSTPSPTTKASASDCIKIREMLDLYSRSSGQRINYDKSAMCSSRDVQAAHGDHLASIIGVHRVKCHERYLCLPSFTGVSKNVLLMILKTCSGVKSEVGVESFYPWRGRRFLLNQCYSPYQLTL
ncbi:hypothetical protein Dsin_012881 [Dipteronia sinensis]|uniref:Reverse transcriptase n=1 Tax=Dipteronia sinensis TaxID=43782 RepID=A0AAE0AJ34_9ROSI|nr:hypothetical protein Dsin_012881 [Dipteronia sinensis]